MNITFDKYHDYRELSEFLHACVSEYPGLCSLQSIGRSPQGRDIWMLEVTNRETGAADEKPAVYLDGNIHAGEVTGCETVIWIIKHLLESFQKDSRVEFLLGTRAFYFVPRISVDGSEHYLTTPDMLRSSPLSWPKTYDDKPGLHPEDIDGDGKILTMRIEDPDGGWKISADDPRLMIKRRPNEAGDQEATYYHVYSEGIIHDFDPDLTVNKVPDEHALDFNRNFPTNWAPHTRQPGAGDYPFSQIETESVAKFILSKPNIVCLMAYHTYGGYVLRPFCGLNDSEMDQNDLRIYLSTGQVAEEVTGYPCKSIFEWFTRDKSKPSVGSVLEWTYETLGILSFATELWDMRARAGLPKRPSHTYLTTPDSLLEEEELELLKWNDHAANGSLFADWKAFEHPQLGKVEIGGWEPKFGRQNPPVSMLEEECKRNGLFALDMAAITPSLEIEKAISIPIENGLFKLEAVVKNSGYLPSHGMFTALKMKTAEPVKAYLIFSEEESCQPELISGKLEQELGHLGGRAGGGDYKKKVSWIVKGNAGSQITIMFSSNKAGKVKQAVAL